MACNVNIFFGKMVTCTTYGATLRVQPLKCNALRIRIRWVVGYTLYFPGGSTPIVSIRSTFVNKIIIFLDVYVLSIYYIGNKASFKASATNHITPKQVHFGFI